MRDTRIALAPYTIVVFIVIAILSALFSAFSQTPAVLTVPVYKATEIQSLRLQVKQRDAWLLQKEWLAAQVRYQQAVSALQAEGDAIKRENKWPDSVVFNPDSLEFTPPPPPGPVPANRPPAPSVNVQ